MTAADLKPTVVVIGPLGGVGGMATSMRLQLTSRLIEQYQFIAVDNSKRTPPRRPLWQGIRAQWALVRELLEVLRRRQPDLVHIHTCSGLSFYRSMVDLLLAKFYSCRVVLHIRGGRFCEFLGRLDPLSRLMVTKALSWADAVVALSPGWAERLRRFNPDIKVQVIHNGVVLPVRPPDRGVPATRRVVFVGTLRRAKGIDDLLAALAALPPPLREIITARIIGPDPGSRAGELHDRAGRAGLGRCWNYLGVLSPQAVAEELRQADVFVLPSHAEGLPNSLLEAMAHGVACVATTVGAVPEVLRHDIDGLIVPPGNPAALAEALERLIREPSLQIRLGRAARKRVEQHFDQQQVLNCLDDLYRRTLAPNGD